MKTMELKLNQKIHTVQSMKKRLEYYMGKKERERFTPISRYFLCNMVIFELGGSYTDAFKFIPEFIKHRPEKLFLGDKHFSLLWFEATDLESRLEIIEKVLAELTEKAEKERENAA